MLLTIPSRKSVSPVHVLLFLIIAGLALTVVLLGHKTNQTNERLEKSISDNSMRLSLLYNEIDYQKSLDRPVLSPQENLMVFPGLKIAVPYDEISKTLQYSTVDLAHVGTSVTSTLLNDHQIRQMSCDQLVRVNFKNGNPFSPWEESAGSVKLSDGRTLYIVAAKAFKNNQASTVECASQVWHAITPAQVVEVFKKAQAY